MNQTIKILSVALFIQLALAAFTSLGGGSSLETFSPEEPLLNLSLDSLSEIRVTQGGEKSDEAITLVKSESVWKLKDYYDFPVALKKLEAFSDKLFTIKKPYPVGSTKIAAKQFEVGDAKYKAKVEFVKDDTVIDTLYLGSSPTFKRVHARLGGSDVTFSIPFSIHQVQGKPSTWVDRNYLKVSEDAVQKITYENFSIVQDSDDQSFTIEGLAENEAPTKDKIADLVKHSVSSSFLDVLGNEMSDSYGLLKPAFSYTLTTKDGKEKTYDYGKVDGESYYALKVSTEPYFFKISNYQAEKIFKTSRDDLIEVKKEEVTEVEEPASTSDKASSGEES